MDATTREKAQPWRGEIWWVDFPNRPTDPHLPRTAIVVSNDLRNEFAQSVLAIPISDEGKNKLLPTHVFLAKGLAGLNKDSTALCDQIASLDKECFAKGPIGKLPSTVMTALVKALSKAVE